MGALVGAIFIQNYYDLTSSSQRFLIDLAASVVVDVNKIFVRTQAMAGIVFAGVGVAVVVGVIGLIGRIITSKKYKGKKNVILSMVCLQFHMTFARIQLK